jgi:hypothetical protein
MEDKRIIAIDLGDKGAIVTMDLEGNLIAKYKMPILSTEEGRTELQAIFSSLMIESTIKDIDYVALCCEDILHPIFGSSKQTALIMGFQYGIIETTARYYNLNFQSCIAKVWQKEIFKKYLKKTNQELATEYRLSSHTTSKLTKIKAAEVAKDIFDSKDLLFPKGKKPHEGLIDAMLIGKYWIDYVK